MNQRPTFRIKIGGRSVLLGERTLIMGVLNVTPDSFSDGGLYSTLDAAAAHAVEMARAGADWIDIGGESTRPGAKPINAEEELRRVLPVVRAVRKELPFVPISIDTTKSVVAEAAVRAGANIINDVSGLRFDRQIAAVARRHSALLILMHLRGRPETMQQKPFARSVWRSVREGLAWSIRQALGAGLSRRLLILDPGLGFGKTRRQNFQLLAHLERLQSFRLPILLGTSRKSFVQAVVAGEGLDPVSQKKGKADRWKLHSAFSPDSFSSGARGGRAPSALIVGDAAAAAACVLAGAHIVRVHGVESVLPAVRIADAVLAAGR